MGDSVALSKDRNSVRTDKARRRARISDLDKVKEFWVTPPDREYLRANPARWSRKLRRQAIRKCILDGKIFQNTPRGIAQHVRQNH